MKLSKKINHNNAKTIKFHKSSQTENIDVEVSLDNNNKGLCPKILIIIVLKIKLPLKL